MSRSKNRINILTGRMVTGITLCSLQLLYYHLYHHTTYQILIMTWQITDLPDRHLHLVPHIYQLPINAVGRNLLTRTLPPISALFELHSLPQQHTHQSRIKTIIRNNNSCAYLIVLFTSLLSGFPFAVSSASLRRRLANFSIHRRCGISPACLLRHEKTALWSLGRVLRRGSRHNCWWVGRAVENALCYMWVARGCCNITDARAALLVLG